MMQSLDGRKGSLALCSIVEESSEQTYTIMETEAGPRPAGMVRIVFKLELGGDGVTFDCQGLEFDSFFRHTKPSTHGRFH